MVAVFHDDGIFQPAIHAYGFANGMPKQRNVMLLQPLIEKLGGNLYRQHLIL
jgi:hypothetical protein